MCLSPGLIVGLFLVWLVSCCCFVFLEQIKFPFLSYSFPHICKCKSPYFLQVFWLLCFACGTNSVSQACKSSLAMFIALNFLFAVSAKFNYSPEQRRKSNLPPAHFSLANTGMVAVGK